MIDTTSSPYAGWVWPLEVKPGPERTRPVISDGYKAKATATTRQHLGVDLMYKRSIAGTPNLPGSTKWFECVGARVMAAFDGTVWSANLLDPHGISVEIDHHQVAGVGPRVTVYRHLDLCYVKKGESVKAGQILGVAGYDRTRPASETPNHLHFEIWDTSRPKVTGNPREDFGFDPAPVMALWRFRDRYGREDGPDGKVLVAGSGAVHGGEEPTFEAVAGIGAEMGMIG